jgi:hypothetical protein
MIRDVLAKRDSPPTKIIKRPHSQELGHVFSRFGFYSFLGEYFSDDFRKPINDLIEQIEIGTKGNYAFWPMSDYKASKAAFSSFSSEDIVRDVRINTISPFSKKTAQKFLPILKDHHHLAYTMFAKMA